MKHRPELDEYTPNQATQARERDRRRLAKERQRAADREAQQRQAEAEEARKRAIPIEEREQLASAVSQLAGAWGLKKKQ